VELLHLRAELKGKKGNRVRNQMKRREKNEEGRGKEEDSIPYLLAVLLALGMLFDGFSGLLDG
jgi:hypothetical protein